MLFKIVFGLLISLAGLYTLIKKDTSFIVGYDFHKDDSKDVNVYDKSKICNVWGSILLTVGLSNFVTLIYDFLHKDIFNLIGSLMFIVAVFVGVYFSLKKDYFKK